MSEEIDRDHWLEVINETIAELTDMDVEFSEESLLRDVFATGDELSSFLEVLAERLGIEEDITSVILEPPRSVRDLMDDLEQFFDDQDYTD